ncbi:hypothetical protein FRB95_003197, partial [Tulasnella sp. JGI-2019a]
MASTRSHKGLARSSPCPKEVPPMCLGLLHFISFNHPIRTNNNKFRIVDPPEEHNNCLIWETSLHKFVKVNYKDIETVQLVTREEHYKLSKVPAYENLDGRKAANLILKLIDTRENPVEEPAIQQGEGQEVENLLEESETEHAKNQPQQTQAKGKAPAITLSAPPTASKPVTLLASAPKGSTPTTPVPQPQAGSSLQGPSISTTQTAPPQMQTSQQQQPQQNPPLPPPASRQLTASMSTAPTKAKWALPG